MAGNDDSPSINIDEIKVKVFGEKKGRYDIDSLPKLKYKRKDKPRYKRRSRGKAASSYNELNEEEPDDVENIGEIVHGHQNTSAAVTDTLEVLIIIVS